MRSSGAGRFEPSAARQRCLGNSPQGNNPLSPNTFSKSQASGWLRLLTKKEKAWFFFLCGYQPKINGLIFLVF